MNRIKDGGMLMHGERTGFFRLLVILIVFVISVLLINKNTKQNVLPLHLDIQHDLSENSTSFSFEQLYGHIHSLLLSRNISLIIRAISQCNTHYIYGLVEKIVQDATLPLTHKEKIDIMCGVVACSSGKKILTHKLFDLFLLYPELYAQTPLLLTLARAKQSDIITSFLQWLENSSKTDNNTYPIQIFICDALSMAIAENDCSAAEIILNKKIHINKEAASNLLWHAVKYNKNALFVPLFVRCASADVDYSCDGKRTLLIQAVENNNISLVQALLEEGARIDYMLDDTIGSAISVAQRCGKDEIISLLM